MSGFLEKLRRDKEAAEAAARRDYERWNAQAHAEAMARNAREEQIRRNLEASRQMFDQTRFLEMAEELKRLRGGMKLDIVEMEYGFNEIPGAYGIKMVWNKGTNTSGNYGGKSWHDQLHILVVGGENVYGIGKHTQKEPLSRILGRLDEQERMLERAYSNPHHVIYDIEPASIG